MTLQLPQIGFEQWTAASSGWAGPTSGLVNRWPLDNANISGSVATDVIGGNNGTIHGTVTSATGPQGTDTCRQFDGITGYISCSSMLAVAAAPVSFFCWGYFTATPSLYQPFVSFRNASGVWYGLGIWDGTLDIAAGSDVAALMRSTGSLATGTWLHLGFTYDGTTLICYRNASSVSTTQDAGWANNYGNSQYTMMAFLKTSNSTWYYNNGRLKQVVAYNRALSSAEVTQLYGAY